MNNPELLSRALEVRNEVEEGANTALRIGQILYDIIQAAEESGATNEIKAIFYDKSQDLDASEMEQAMVNIGLQNFKGKLLVSDLDSLDPTWWCWGETDYFNDPTEDDAVAKDNNFFWWQSSRMVEGELETSQTRINGRRFQRRKKKGINTSWTGIEWNDIGGSNLYRYLGYLSTEETDKVLPSGPYGGWIESEIFGIIFQFVAGSGAGGEGTIYQIAMNPGVGWQKRYNSSATVGQTKGWTEWKPLGSCVAYLKAVSVDDIIITEDEKPCWIESEDFGIIFQMRSGTEITQSIIVSGVVMKRKNTTTGSSTSWTEWEPVTATENTEGTVKIIDKNLVADFSLNAGKAVVCDSEGKIPYNVLKYAKDDVSNGGIVKVTYNGGADQYEKVPIIGPDGFLSNTVIPSNNKLTYSVEIDSSGGVYLHIAEAKNAIFGAEVKVLVTGVKVKTSPSTSIQGVNIKKTVNIYNRCYSNGDLTEQVSAYFIDSGAPVLSVPYDGNDVKIPLESLSEYGESGVNYSNLAYSAAVVVEAKY